MGMGMGMGMRGARNKKTIERAGIGGKARGAPNLVECEGAFVLEDAARTVQHALVPPRRRGLHPLSVGRARVSTSSPSEADRYPA